MDAVRGLADVITLPVPGPGFIGELIKRGYTVFAVVHGSQPKYTIPEILQDMNRALPKRASRG